MKKKLLFTVIVLIVALSMITSIVNAATYSITINNTKTGHIYSGYQIFTGNISNGKLTNIQWGTGVNGSDLLTALKANTAYASCNTAEDVAEVVSGFADNSEEIDAFATIVGQNLTSTKVDSTYASGVYTISGLTDGYYLVKDSIEISTLNDAYSKYIVDVVGSGNTINAKVSIPTIELTANDKSNASGTYSHFNNYPLNNNIPMKIETGIPSMDGYTSFTYIVEQTLTNGFTVNDDLVVTIGSETLTEGTDYTKTYENNKLTIDFINFINHKDDAGQKVEIKYTAKLNSNANTGKTANVTSAKLTYSNNPYASTTSKATLDSAYVYCTNLDLFKLDGKDNSPLTGATFDVYDSNNTKIDTITTNGSGHASLVNGLAAGTYTLREIVPPEGYSTLKNPVVFTVTCTYPTNVATSTDCTWGVTNTANNEIKSCAIVNDRVKVEVLNANGLNLPMTGGVGYVVFVAIGVVLVTAAIALFVVIRKKDNKK